MTNPAKRLIKAIPLPGVLPGRPPTKKPEITWIDPTELLVDESYQRGIGEKGLRLIRRVVENFDWRRFKPPTAVWTDVGLEVVDGQHSAIAAACHPSVDTIPVVIVEAADLKDRASAFIGINKDRLNVTMMQIHAAGVVAGDPEALQIAELCGRCSIRLLKSAPSSGEYKPRDSVAVRALGDLIKRRGLDGARAAIDVVVAAEPAPLNAAAIKAVDFLLHDKEHADAFDPADLTKAIVALADQADRDAGVFAAEHCVPKWRGLAAVWFKKTRKRRTRAEAESAGDEPSEPAPCAPALFPAATATARVLRWQRGSATASICGDPPPGRSALDQRRAAHA